MQWKKIVSYHSSAIFDVKIASKLAKLISTESHSLFGMAAKECKGNNEEKVHKYNKNGFR